MNEHRNIYIKGILHITSLRTNLLSIRYLTKIGNEVTFSGNSVKITGSEKELRLDKEENRGYTLEARLRNNNKSQLSSEKVVLDEKEYILVRSDIGNVRGAKVDMMSQHRRLGLVCEEH